ncbi:MAG: translation initiation factor IF-2 subunit alpha [Methermicoccaceae archaeon]
MVEPEPGDFVVCTVKDVQNFGAFVDLDEYPGVEGFIHISEVAAGWIKYIRDHIREGQKIVCKVLTVGRANQRIDLSLKDVNEHQKRAKIQEWKNEQKATKWLSFLEERAGISEEDIAILKDKFLENFSLLYEGFEKVATNGPEVLVELGVPEEWAQEIAMIASENINLPQVTISGYLDIICPLPDGVDVIKGVLSGIYEIKEKDVNLEVTYTGAPRYRMTVTAPNYKLAEQILRKAADKAIDNITKHGGHGEFHRYNGSAR